MESERTIGRITERCNEIINESDSNWISNAHKRHIRRDRKVRRRAKNEYNNNNNKKSSTPSYCAGTCFCFRCFFFCSFLLIAILSSVELVYFNSCLFTLLLCNHVNWIKYCDMHAPNVYGCVCICSNKPTTRWKGKYNRRMRRIEWETNSAQKNVYTYMRE